MGSLNLDFGGVGAIPPDGTYRWVIDKAKVQPTKAKDGHNIVLTIHMVDSPLPEFEDFKSVAFLSLKVSARWKVKEAFEAITQATWNSDGMTIEVDDDDEVPMLVDQTFLAICTQGEYNNRPQLTLQTYLPDNGEYKIEVTESE